MSGEIRLNQGETVSITVTRSWMGQVSARTECSFDEGGRWDPLNCATGNCVSEECGRPYTTPSPTTLANFLLDGPNNTDRYSISLLAGFNIPISVVPYGGSGECRPISCLTDLNPRCPSALQVRSNGRVVGCNSACLAFDRPEYCCTGAYESPDACKPSSYSRIFKGSCPAAATYPRDDPSSFVSCKGANYLISFC
ncbi:pathogenesis-related thaumatin-like protein 3.5 [Rhododendron vialii]|uniref:pathogenesis-related thaumatin-like protein 3.5 n=1 Tax=Rhododendron vialii TaxID=182163 RepID=UPI00265DA61B|nr:pathogenesis-related thaumatin-like protein 3.5 [Rhododendron vialii]